MSWASTVQNSVRFKEVGAVSCVGARAHPQVVKIAGGEERIGRRLFAKPAGQSMSAASTGSTHAHAKSAAIALR